MSGEGPGRDRLFGRYRAAAVLDLPQELLRLLFALPGPGPRLSLMLAGSIGSEESSTAVRPDLALAQHLALCWSSGSGRAEERRLLASPQLLRPLRAHARSARVLSQLLRSASDREDLAALLGNPHLPPQLAHAAAARFLQEGFRPYPEERQLSFRISSVLAPQLRQVARLLGSSAGLEQFLPSGPPRRLLLRLLQRPSSPSSAGWSRLLAAERAAFRDWSPVTVAADADPEPPLHACSAGGDPRVCCCDRDRPLAPPVRACSCPLLSSPELSCRRLSALDDAQLLRLLGEPRRPVQELDELAGTLWRCLPGRLLAVLAGHEDLTDRTLAALARVSFLPETPEETFPPFSPSRLVSELGVESAAVLLTRLQSVRVRMPPPRPPRYLRTVEGLARRPAARIFRSEASEVRWLLSCACGTDVEPDVARTALLLPPSALQDLSYGESALLLAAASGYSLSRLLSCVAQVQGLEDEPRLLLAAMLLAANLTAPQRRLARSLAESWSLPPCELPQLLRSL